MSTLAEKWIEEGEKKGRTEGYRALVRRQIELKFGILDGWSVTRIDAADDAALERYSERVHTATSVDGVLGD